MPKYQNLTQIKLFFTFVFLYSYAHYQHHSHVSTLFDYYLIKISLNETFMYAEGGTMPAYSLFRLMFLVVIAIITCSAVGVFTYVVVSALAE